jgi:hypothetical protein
MAKYLLEVNVLLALISHTSIASLSSQEMRRAPVHPRLHGHRNEETTDPHLAKVLRAIGFRGLCDLL